MTKKIQCLLLAILIPVGCLLTGCAQETDNTAETEKIEMKNDGVLNLLMVGSSYCYYYVEELYELLMDNPPEGITEVNVYNLYYSGCRLTWHLNWWQEGKSNYDLFKVDATGRKKVPGLDKWSLDQGLAMADWDYISLQGTPVGYRYYQDDPNQIALDSEAQAEPILDYLHQRFPNAKLLWHGTWIPEVGRVDTSGHIYTQEEVPVYNAAMLQVCRHLCEQIPKDKTYDLTMVPTGLAWTKAREQNETDNLLPYGGLCARLGKNAFGDGRENSGDGSHDGDIGGGQYLNACVWFEIITGKDCRDTSYIPTYVHNSITYTVDGALRTMLQEAAHNAVEEIRN